MSVVLTSQVVFLFFPSICVFIVFQSLLQLQTAVLLFYTYCIGLTKVHFFSFTKNKKKKLFNSKGFH